MTTNNSVNGPFPLAINKGGTAVASVTTAPAASAWAGWDANKNLSANNMNQAFTTTVTSAVSYGLTVSSTYLQFFTGSTAQQIYIPYSNTVALGQSYLIVNLASASLQLSGQDASVLIGVPPGASVLITCIAQSPTGAASCWNALFLADNSAVSGNFLTTTPTITFATPGDLSVSYSSRTQVYRTTNGICFFQSRIVFTPTYTTASGNLYLSLPVAPYASAGVQYCNAVGGFTYPAGAASLLGYIASQSIQIVGVGSGISGTFISTTQVPTGVAQGIDFWGNYFV
jgi:hypothetical protein